MKKTIIILAVVFVLAGLTLFSAAFIVSGFDFTKLDTAKYETNTYTADNDFKRIEINSKEADIIFKPSKDGKLKVVCVELEKAKHNILIEDETLKISVNDKREWYDNFGIFLKSLSITVYLPNNQYENLKIDSDTGDVSLPRTFNFGSVDIKESTGDVVCGASVSGLFNIKASTGDINLSGSKAERIKISVSTGDITLNNITASDSLDVKSSTGDVNFKNCDAGSITVKTSTGDVTGTLKSGKIFTTKTSTGTVSVPNTNSGGKCNITTSTGDINITVCRKNL